jgi:hypothetical protein
MRGLPAQAAERERNKKEPNPGAGELGGYTAGILRPSGGAGVSNEPKEEEEEAENKRRKIRDTTLKFGSK